MQVVGVNLRHVVNDLNPLAEVLARNIHAPLCRQIKKRPAVRPTRQHRDIPIPHPLSRRRSKMNPLLILIAEHDRSINMRHRISQLKLQNPPRNQTRPNNVRSVVLRRIPNINQSNRRIL